MTTIKVNTITNAAGTGAPNIPDGILIKGATLAATNTLDYYAQGTEPSSPNNAAVWYDTGTDQFKMYVGGAWVEVSYSDLPTWFGDRGLFGGGYTGSYSNVIDYVAIPTAGNATDFGDLTVAVDKNSSCSSGTRGLFAGGESSGGGFGQENVISYVTIATTGNATDFGDLTVARASLAACSSVTRGLFGSGIGSGANQNVVDYVTIATTGNATDFGDLTVVRNSISACSNGTYGLFGGGYSSGGFEDTIDYVSIDTPSNASDFGNLTVGRQSLAASSNTTYGLFGGGWSGSNFTENVIDYVTIATPGNATDFGDLTIARNGISSCSNDTYALFGGGYDSAASNIIDYVTIASPGNATDFGDLTVARERLAACSGD